MQLDRKSQQTENETILVEKDLMRKIFGLSETAPVEFLSVNQIFLNIPLRYKDKICFDSIFNASECLSQSISPLSDVNTKYCILLFLTRCDSSVVLTARLRGAALFAASSLEPNVRCSGAETVHPVGQWG